MNILRQHQLYAKANKCLIAVKKIEFLGQMNTAKGMCPMEGKLHAVKEWNEPKTLKTFCHFGDLQNITKDT